MNFFNMIIRLALSGVVFLNFVVLWAVVPYFDSGVDLNLTFISAFYGNNPPTGIVRDLLLASRAMFGLALSSFILMPALLFFAEFEAERVSRTLAVVFGLLCVVVFFISLIVFNFFYI